MRSPITSSDVKPAMAAETKVPVANAEQQRLAADFAITFNGRHYVSDGYRYDALADAINYAVRDRSKHPGIEKRNSRSARELVENPDESQRCLMATLGITIDKGVYHLGAYRYDRLADAVDYSRRYYQRELANTPESRGR